MAKIKPFFSIIVPALNEAKYLPHLLSDLSQQSFRDFEVIVVDGHSDDTTVAKAKALTSKRPNPTILNSPRRHVCTQRNLGAKHAHADVLIFMDADNRLPPYFLQGIKYRLEQTGSQLISTWVQLDTDTPSSKIITTAINLGTELQNNVKPTFILEAMIIVTRSAFQKIGGFNEHINYAEGIQFIKTALANNIKPVYCKDPHFIYSTRRIKQSGTPKFIANFALLNLRKFTNQKLTNELAQNLYPMQGGIFFDKPYQKQQSFIKSIQKLLQDF